MKHETSLQDLIKKLKVELIAAVNDSSNDSLSISSAEVSFNFSIEQSDKGGIAFNAKNNENDLSHNLKLTFSRKTTPDSGVDLSLVDDEKQLETAQQDDGFDTFKKRFEANVKLKHGQSPSKKKSIFDD